MGSRATIGEKKTNWSGVDPPLLPSCASGEPKQILVRENQHKHLVFISFLVFSTIHRRGKA
jgi:hypothetical protein